MKIISSVVQSMKWLVHRMSSEGLPPEDFFLLFLRYYGGVELHVHMTPYKEDTCRVSDTSYSWAVFKNK